MVIGLRPCSNERELTWRYPIVVAVFMVEGMFGEGRRVDRGGKEERRRMAWKGEKRGKEEKQKRRSRRGAGTCKRTGCIVGHTRIV